ncbi:hypothetical protein C8R46DRAFT_908802 [Mycena filopes]|nr:hypothetical protein C8R46DRAFT_908802 [Mycena filopes]
MSSFDPAVVLAILVAIQPPSGRTKFERDWKSSVQARLSSWKNSRATQSNYAPQLEFEANVAEYVTFLHRETKPPTVPKTSTKIPKPPALKPGVPVYGPKFIPPSLNDARLRLATKVKPQTAYLRPINIIHPIYYPTLGKCPHCGSCDVRWDGWNATGSREVHGLRREETALGYQLRHDSCTPDEGSTKSRTRSFATTNQLFWQRWEHWEIPRK